MTIEASRPNSIKHPRCRHFTADGTRCRLPILDTRSHLCFRHSALSAAVAQPPQNDSEDLSPDLLPELSEFDSAVDINKFLARLVVLVTKGRISPRRASVLAYITNQLLHSHRAIDRENFLQLEDSGPPRLEAGDIPRPGDSRLGKRHQSRRCRGTANPACPELAEWGCARARNADPVTLFPFNFELSTFNSLLFR